MRHFTPANDYNTISKYFLAHGNLGTCRTSLASSDNPSKTHSACVADMHAIFLRSIAVLCQTSPLHIRKLPCHQVVSHPVQMHAGSSFLQHDFISSCQNDFMFCCCHCHRTCCWHEASALLLDALIPMCAAIKSHHHHCSSCCQITVRCVIDIHRCLQI